MLSVGPGCPASGSATTGSACNCTRWPATWRPCLTLHRSARGHGRLVADQPATQADQDRGPRGASRPRHPRPTGRGRGDRRNGQGHPCCDPSSPSATAMRVTLKLPEGKRKRQDKSVRRAETLGRLTKMMHIRRPSRPLSAGPEQVDTAQGTDHLISRRNRTNLSSGGRPLGECRFRSLDPCQALDLLRRLSRI